MNLLLTLLLPAALLAEAPPPLTPSAPPASIPKGSPERLFNTIRWKTASEVDSLAFDVYRAAVESGPFTRITKRQIRGAGNSDEPRDYAYVDETIEAGASYWYYVESISTTGVREKFTPTFMAPVKGVRPTPTVTPTAPKAGPSPSTIEKR